MTDKQTFLDLAARVEYLDGPCFGTEDAIEKAIGQPWRYPPPNYTASIDAALTLISPDSFFRLGHDIDGPDISRFRASVGFVEGESITFSHRNGATPALALTAAALSAIAGGLS